MVNGSTRDDAYSRRSKSLEPDKGLLEELNEKNRRLAMLKKRHLLSKF